METYLIKFGANKEANIEGINLESALENHGFTNIEIVPLWQGKSNGKYKAYCNESAIVLCFWTRKINQLKLGC